MHQTLHLLTSTDFPAIRRHAVLTLQVNLGYLCNQTCVHCHVDAGPHRTERMGRETVDLVLDAVVAKDIATVDITGGAPELNPHFRHLVSEARGRGVHVIDRCNLTVLLEPGQEDSAEFLAAQQVEIVASLPCYLEDNVDRQRGKGVFEKSLRVLRQLNELGYGVSERLPLSLVYNPQGASLPPPQAALEADYRKYLGERHGIVFTRLLTLANMPISRFGSMLISQGRLREYMQLLRASHRPANLAGVMCRTLLSVDWQGFLYDCDFNQMLGLPLREAGSDGLPGHGRIHLSDWMAMDLTGNPIVVADHCYGCTAGQGSSCSGALA
ncbi:MAG TPA: arsenosugar biosynthesis radical SAM (seleno)protein ArsS [Burkholderiaceae bacterium]